METKKLLAEIEKGCGKDLGDYSCGDRGYNVPEVKYEPCLCSKCKAKKQGFLLGTISQLKKWHISEGCMEGCSCHKITGDNPDCPFTTDLKFYEDKLNEVKE